ncbi:MAG: T9SS type A sorting domain-containing protein [Bacteroidota bacterium]
MCHIKHIICLFLLLISGYLFCQFPPPAGQSGSTAIYKDSSVFVEWAKSSVIERGFLDISDKNAGFVNYGDSVSSVGFPGENGFISLGDSGVAILTFYHPICNGQGPDFAVFENSFNDDFLELAFVEVSSDSVNFFRFPSVSLTDTLIQTDPYGATNAEKIHNLAGKYRANYGTPFDLEDLTNVQGLNVNNITHIKIIDVIGSINDLYATRDSYGNKINDPWPTPFSSGGFDLDAVGVIHSTSNIVKKTVSDEEILIYPNPVSDFLFIQLSEISDFTITINNLTGEILYKNSFKDTKFEKLNLSEFPNGLLIVKIEGEKLELFNKLLKLKD